MRDEPNAKSRRGTARSSDTINGVGSLKQQGGGHGRRNLLSSA